MKKVSIIVPVYNAQNSIGRCIESILNQDYENIELIAVNDGRKYWMNMPLKIPE